VKSKNEKNCYLNRKASFDYQIFDTFEAGIVLTGLEIKAIRAGKVNMTTSYAKVINEEVFWLGGNLGILEGDQQRTRKLLLKGDEIKKIQGKLTQERMLLIPLKLYIKRGKAKLLVGLARGKKKFDKREMIKKRDQERDSERIIKLK
jgi:SsrA-binding protein